MTLRGIRITCDDGHEQFHVASLGVAENEPLAWLGGYGWSAYTTSEAPEQIHRLNCHACPDRGRLARVGDNVIRIGGSRGSQEVRESKLRAALLVLLDAGMSDVTLRLVAATIQRQAEPKG